MVWGRCGWDRHRTVRLVTGRFAILLSAGLRVLSPAPLGCKTRGRAFKFPSIPPYLVSHVRGRSKVAAPAPMVLRPRPPQRKSRTGVQTVASAPAIWTSDRRTLRGDPNCGRCGRTSWWRSPSHGLEKARSGYPDRRCSAVRELCGDGCGRARWGEKFFRRARGGPLAGAGRPGASPRGRGRVLLPPRSLGVVGQPPQLADPPPARVSALGTRRWIGAPGVCETVNPRRLARDRAGRPGIRRGTRPPDPGVERLGDRAAHVARPAEGLGGAGLERGWAVGRMILGRGGARGARVGRRRVHGGRERLREQAAQRRPLVVREPAQEGQALFRRRRDVAFELDDLLRAAPSSIRQPLPPPQCGVPTAAAGLRPSAHRYGPPLRRLHEKRHQHTIPGPSHAAISAAIWYNPPVGPRRFHSPRFPCRSEDARRPMRPSVAWTPRRCHRRCAGRGRRLPHAPKRRACRVTDGCPRATQDDFSSSTRSGGTGRLPRSPRHGGYEPFGAVRIAATAGELSRYGGGLRMRLGRRPSGALLRPPVGISRNGRDRPDDSPRKKKFSTRTARVPDTPGGVVPDSIPRRTTRRGWWRLVAVGGREDVRNG